MTSVCWAGDYGGDHSDGGHAAYGQLSQHSFGGQLGGQDYGQDFGHGNLESGAGSDLGGYTGSDLGSHLESHTSGGLDGHAAAELAAHGVQFGQHNFGDGHEHVDLQPKVEVSHDHIPTKKIEKEKLVPYEVVKKIGVPVPNPVGVPTTQVIKVSVNMQ